MPFRRWPGGSAEAFLDILLDWIVEEPAMYTLLRVPPSITARFAEWRQAIMAIAAAYAAPCGDPLRAIRCGRWGVGVACPVAAPA